jgi:hypothetical protein
MLWHRGRKQRLQPVFVFLHLKQHLLTSMLSCAFAGAGGNPTSKPTSSDSYALWMQQPLRPSDSVTAQLASQLEWAKAQLQRYADLAEAAQLQAGCTVEQATQHVGLWAVACAVDM